MSALMFLRLDMDLHKTVHLHHEVGYENWVLRGNTLLTMQLLFVFVVQANLFNELIGSLRLLLFVLNPSTWTDIRRPDPAVMRGLVRFLYYPTFVAPLPVLAMMFKCVIGYQVCVDSISIILACDSERDVIYDCLVIAFISDLDEVFWNVCSVIFHFDDFQGFDLKTASHEFVKRCRAEVKWRPLHTWLKCLRRAEGGRKWASFLSFAIVFVFYCRQLTVMLFALDTNVLPMSRDVCTLWRWDRGKTEDLQWLAWLVGMLENYFLVMNTHDRLRDFDEVCSSSEYDRMRWRDVVRMFHEYTDVCIIGSLSLVTIFITPQLIHFVNGKLVKISKDFEEDDEEIEEYAMRKRVEALRRDVDFLLEKGGLSRRSRFVTTNSTSMLHDIMTTTSATSERAKRIASKYRLHDLDEDVQSIKAFA